MQQVSSANFLYEQRGVLNIYIYNNIYMLNILAVNVKHEWLVLFLPLPGKPILVHGALFDFENPALLYYT